MGKTYQSIDARLQAWIEAQQIFFVATAPLSADGLINCSPKGGDSFRVLSGNEVVYQDYTGSGVETIAHLRENGRILIMFCAFDGPPTIVRLHGVGSVITAEHPRYAELLDHFPPNPGTRALIHIQVQRISDSCGFSVPRYDFIAQRDTLDKWAASKGEEGLREYRHNKNRLSLDGLPGLEQRE